MKSRIFTIAAAIFVSSVSFGGISSSASASSLADELRKITVDAEAEQLMIDQSPVYQAVQKGVDLLAQKGLKSSDNASVYAFDPDQEKPEGTGRTIAVQVGTLNQSYLKMVAIGAEAALRDGDKIRVYSYDQDNERQLQQVETMVASGVDVILVQPQDPSAASASARLANRSGVPMISMDLRLANEDDVAGFFLGDDYGIGYYGGLQLAKAYFDEHGDYNAKIMVYNSLSVTQLVVRQRGFMDAIANFPGMEIVSQVQGMWTTEAALGPISDALVANPDVNAFWTIADPCTIAAVQVFREAGRPDIIVATNEATSWVVQMMEQDRVHAGLDLAPYAMGYGAVEMAYDLLDGTPFEKVQYVSQIPVFKDDYQTLGVTYKIEDDLLKSWTPPRD